MKSLRHNLYIVLTVFAFTGCAAIGGSSDIFSIGGTSATGGTSTPTGSGATTTDDATGTTGDTELMPTIPVASGDSFLITDTNSSSSSQLLGTGLDASYSLLVSTAGSMNDSPSQRPLFGKEGAAQPGALLALGAGIDALLNQTLRPIYFVYDYYKLKTGGLSAGVFFARYINPSLGYEKGNRKGYPYAREGQSWWNQIIPPAYASSTTCSGTIVPISADGSVSYELPNVAAGMSYSIQYVDAAAAAAGDCSTVGEAVYESPVSAVQFVAGDTASSTAIAFDGTDSACSVITDASTATNIMQEMAYTTDTGFEVASTTAEHTTCAVDSSLISDGLEIDFNSSAVLSVRDESLVTSTGGYSSVSVCLEASGCSPVRMKNNAEKEYYSMRFDSVSGSKEGFLGEVYDNPSNHIVFLPTSDPSYLKQTLAYDVDDSQTALVVFETVDGETMVATKTIHSSLETDGLANDVIEASTPAKLDFDGDVLDIWSYGDFPAASVGRDSYDGKAVLLSTSHLYQMTYDALGVITTTSTGTDPCAGLSEEEAAETEGCGATSSTSTSGDSKSVTIASSLSLSHTAAAMVLNDAKDTVYILNTDSSVTLVDPVTLTEVAGPVSYDADADGTITADEAKMALGYDFDYALTSIKYVTTDDGAGGSNHYLLLGANGLDSVLTIAIE
jgi:hypothetical protein